MREYLAILTEQAVLWIDVVALLVILGGTVQAIIGMAKVTVTGASANARRAVWLHYARWLIAGLTFQLAADIIETSTTSDWEAIARVAAIAVIRTFMSHFLEKDFNELREREGESS